MSVLVKEISWSRTILEVHYEATQGERLFLHCLPTGKSVLMESLSSEGGLVARLNLAILEGRKPLEASDWLICSDLGAGVLPHRSGKVAKPKRSRTERLSLVGEVSPNLAGISYSDEVLLSLESLGRVFRYADGEYAYTATVLPEVGPGDTTYLFLAVDYYARNSKPQIRKHSLRFREKQVLAAMFKALCAFAPKKGNRILFLKENGLAPTANMQALIDRLYERGLDKEYKIEEHYRDIFAKTRQSPIGWLKDLWAIACSDYIFIDDYCPVFNFLQISRRTVLTQIWHAGVGFKSVGYARFGQDGSPDPLASSHRAYTYALVGNEHLRDVYSEVFGIEEEALLATGMPRLDHFLDEGVADKARADLLSRYPWMAEGRVILFAPTFRGTGQDVAYYPYDAFFDMDSLYAMCERTNSYFVFEMHHFIKDAPEIPAAYRDRIFDLSSESLDALYHVGDVLVTDYSSCFYDYLLLEKPVVFYVPDKVAYSATRGVQRPVDEMAPGCVCDTFESFMEVLESGSYASVEPDPSCIDRCIESGMLASDRAIDTIILGKDVPGVRK